MAISLIGCAAEEYLDDELENDTEELPEEVEEEETNGESEDIDRELTTLATGLEIPLSIAMDDNTIYLTECVGAIVKIEGGDQIRQEVQLEEELSTEQEAGLLGFVLDPEFSITKEAIAYYTYAGDAGATNRIVRLQLEDNVWREVDLLLDNVSSGSIHHGGRLAIGADEKLYATTGDATEPNLAQDLNSLAGKILRLEMDGTIPEDNPDPASYIYTYGHRNAQGIAWLDDGTMFASEHGNQANDEINQIEASYNYGWPIIEGEEEQKDMVAPIFTSGSNQTWASSGMDASKNVLYVAGLRGNSVYEFNLDSNEECEILTDFGRIRDVYIEEEHLFFITNDTDGRGNPTESDDQLFRIGLSEIE